MPKVIKKKPAKKKPVQETEEVKSAALHALDAMRGRQKQMLVIVSAIAAIVIIIIVFMLYSSSRNKKARDLEIEANSIYYSAGSDNMPGTEKWKRALELYQKAVDIKASPSALLSLGNSYYNLGDYENAIKQYNTFTDKFKNNDVLSPLVYQKLASAYFNTGKGDKALEALASLAKIKNGAFRDTALSMEAGYYDAMGDTAKAKEKYMALVSEYPNSPWSAEATAKVSLNSNNDAQTVEQTPSSPGPAKK